MFVYYSNKTLPARRRLLFPLLHADKGNRRRLRAGKLNPPQKNKIKIKINNLPLEDSVPTQKNEEEVQENKLSRQNSVTAAVSNGQTTSQALTLTLTPSPDRSRKQANKTANKQATFLSRVPVHCITPFCSDALVSPPNRHPPCPTFILPGAKSTTSAVSLDQT